jgi:quercetin dioxygenase-like cupin family protein
MYLPSTEQDRIEKEGQLFCKRSESGYKEVLPGIRLKTLAYGEKMLLAQFTLESGSVLPKHAHPHEQTGYLVEGRIRLAVGDRTFEAGPGDGWSIPAGPSHGAEILERSLAVEVFSPVREDYLPGKS